MLEIKGNISLENLNATLRQTIMFQNHEMIRMDALIQLLIEKGIITKEEYTSKFEQGVQEMKEMVKNMDKKIITPDKNLIV